MLETLILATVIGKTAVKPVVFAFLQFWSPRGPRRSWRSTCFCLFSVCFLIFCYQKTKHIKTQNKKRQKTTKTRQISNKNTEQKQAKKQQKENNQTQTNTQTNNTKTTKQQNNKQRQKNWIAVLFQRSIVNSAEVLCDPFPMYISVVSLRHCFPFISGGWMPRPL